MTDLPHATLNVLGPVDIAARRADGEPPAPRLTQPRLLGLLAYLVLARPRGMHARETLIAMFWPEADASAGRHALRNALHRLRGALGDGAIEAAGDGLVGVAAGRIACDALALDAALAEGRAAAALELYRGELLQGFHVGNAPDFERWVDGERRRLRDAVVAAAWSRAELCRQRGDDDGTRDAARRAMDLAPDDEGSLRRLLAMLDATGDRAGAVRAYAAFARRLRDDLDVEPSLATQAALRALRTLRPPDALEAPVAPRAPPWLAPRARADVAAAVAAVGDGGGDGVAARDARASSDGRLVTRRAAWRHAVGLATATSLALFTSAAAWLTTHRADAEKTILPRDRR